MRLFNLNAQGQLWGVPRRTDGDVECSPETQAACSFNRQDWAAVLKLKPQDELARLGPVAPPSFLPSAPVAPTCCINCVLGSGVPRCPALPLQLPNLASLDISRCHFDGFYVPKNLLCLTGLQALNLSNTEIR